MLHQILAILAVQNKNVSSKLRHFYVSLTDKIGAKKVHHDLGECLIYEEEGAAFVELTYINLISGSICRI